MAEDELLLTAVIAALATSITAEARTTGEVWRGQVVDEVES